MGISSKLKKWRVSSLGNERGIVLPIGLVLMVLLAITGTAAFKSTSVDLKISSNYKTGVSALNLAEAAAEYMREMMNQDVDVDGNSTGEKTQVFTDNDPVNWDSSTMLADLQTGATGTVDVVRDPVDANLATITSKATLAGSTHTVTMVVKKTGPAIPNIPGALTTVSNGTDETDYEDSSLVSGFDESGTCPDKPGWVWRNDDQFDYQGGTLEGDPQRRQFDPAVDDPIYNDPDALIALLDQWESLPGVVTISGTSGHPATFGTATDPQITVWELPDAKNKTERNMTGYGILILKNRNVENGRTSWFNFYHAFDFHGLLIIDGPGEVHFNKNELIHGGVIAVSDRTGDEATKPDFQDNSTVRYNCDSITRYAEPLVGGGGGGGGGGGSSVVTVSWRQE